MKNLLPNIIFHLIYTLCRVTRLLEPIPTHWPCGRASVLRLVGWQSTKLDSQRKGPNACLPDAQHQTLGLGGVEAPNGSRVCSSPTPQGRVQICRTNGTLPLNQAHKDRTPYTQGCWPLPHRAAVLNICHFGSMHPVMFPMKSLSRVPSEIDSGVPPDLTFMCWWPEICYWFKKSVIRNELNIPPPSANAFAASSWSRTAL